ncbi:MAG: hypothetical protein JW997_03325 [Actinobacteria bacterium]|nr:hypothetical protein [Actinomycetota bacterium]
MKVLEKIKLDIPEDIGKDFLTKLMGGMLIPKMEEMLEEKKEICLKSISPKAVYDSFEILEIKGDIVHFRNGSSFNGPNVSKILKGSEVASIFICTLGADVDNEIKKVSESGDSLSTIIMDAITTSILGLLGEYMGKLIRKEGLRQSNWSSTCSYSPGQYKWTIEEQKILFSMVDGSKIGVKLNESFLMLPFKSISGVYGFGYEANIDKTRVACDLCPREDCIGRR